MKTQRIFIALMFIIIGVCKIGASPTNSTFYFAEGTTWTTSFMSVYGGCDDWKKVCVLQGDTLIGDSTYHNILYNDGHGQLIIPIREENKRIFAYLDNQDHLLYDFNLVVGDSLPLCMFEGEYDLYCAYYTHVTAVDSITLSDGRKAKRLTYDWERLPDIEHVGGMYGFLAPIVTAAISTCGGPPSSCCSLNGEPIYETSPGTCARFNPAPPVCADTWYGLIYKVPGMFESGQFEDIKYSLTSDTTIGEHTYRKLIQNDTICVGGLRQTEDGMKVYYYDMVSPSNYPFSHVDCLLYDFTANVGDTIKNVYFREEDIYTDAYHGVDFGGSVVLDKDTIDGRIHMKVGHCDIEGHGPYYETTWIQGIGTRNVIWPDLYGLPGKGWINEVFTLCALHGDEELYTFSLPDYFRIENNCTEWHFTGLNDIPADNSRNRKFLHNGHIYIETPLGTFDATGRKAE